MTQPLLPPGETPRTTAVWRRAVTFDEMTEHARQLERELRLAREDARRYRWLRHAEDQNWNELMRDGGEQLDIAIDKAMKEPR